MRYKRFIPFIIFLFNLCFLLMTCLPVQAAGQRTGLFQGLHPGLNIYRYDWDKESCVLYVAEMDRSASALSFEAAIAADRILGKESVRSTAYRRSQRDDRRVLVAVNGGFGVLGDMRGYGGALENLHIQDGELMTQPVDGEACFGVTAAGEFLIGPVQMQATVTLAEHAISLQCINQRREDGCQSILYTPRVGYSTHTNSRGYEIVLTGLKLPIGGRYESEFVIDQFGKKGNNPIPENGAVLSFRSKLDKALAAQLSEGMRGQIEIALEPPIWNDAVQAIGGRMRLVKNGKVTNMLEGLQRKEKTHTPGRRTAVLPLSHEPRTALGYNDQKLILIVADGRQPGYSTGISLYELATVLIELGATEAINLDGGSSSTFVVDGKVVNRPSGQEERDVLNAVFITVDKEGQHVQ
ncbi:MAG: phosphodiester glycosidase family protein [Candidatus Poribacteria bacterium]|nr:phosphodiester glycosidase family protein [Candidatus Poribacteria bacterium]